MKILRASFVGYRMSSCIQPVYQALNSLDYGWQLIDGVHVPVCIIVYNSELRKK